MKRLALMVFVAGMAFTCAVCADSGPSPASLQIQRIMDRMEKAANAHDTDRFMAGYLHQPTLVFVINGTVIHGWDALHKQQLEWWRRGKSDVIYTQTGPTGFQQLSADAAVTTRTFASRRTLPDGKSSTGSFAVTEIWRKLPQGWRIVYSHESWVR
jgi:ketosteroid isomerase-like protein